ncbi:gamma-butyrobetaine hydroxylase-like domain-containing protein [Collimonas sp. NPDC087041]|uniref:gamma-butyrobetaine hydroxylase-like domain-containing protein n=1 Tax=Collimonas sp. NPDC087041 TaxID=3363960 RepID=UPI00381D916E
MTGSKQSAPAPVPVSLVVHKQSCKLEVAFDDGAVFLLPFELMRVYSPSAEVSGHGPGQEVLQTGKRKVEMSGLEPVGNYAVKPIFSDGHVSGIYTWAYLYKLGRDEAAMWEDYLQRLDAAGHGREAGRDLSMTAKTAGGHGCA